MRKEGGDEEGGRCTVYLSRGLHHRLQQCHRMHLNFCRTKLSYFVQSRKPSANKLILQIRISSVAKL